VAVLEGLTNLGLSIWLGKMIGLPGVMLATVIANLPATTYLLLVTLKRLKVTKMEYLCQSILPSLLPIAIGSVITIICGRFLPERGWVSFFSQGTILIFAYGGIAYRLSLTRAEREWLGGHLLQLLHPETKRKTVLMG
jgi:peptidoglycan biosynthesis protein MviN/MurJ (putative lipid II flippase)